MMALIAVARGQSLISVGSGEGCDLRILGQRFDAKGQDVRYEWKGTPYQVRLNLIGGFQAENVALAAGLVIGAGRSARDVFAVLPQLTGVRGRMQLAGTRKNGASVFVDYALTPDALQTALRALRPHVMGRVIVVFGAGGDRDTTKRPLMGAAARDNADVRFMSPTTTRARRIRLDPGGDHDRLSTKPTRSVTAPRRSCWLSMRCNRAMPC